MAWNIAKTGRTLRVWNRRAGGKADSRGADGAPAETAERVDAVVTVLHDGAVAPTGRGSHEDLVTSDFDVVSFLTLWTG